MPLLCTLRVLLCDHAHLRRDKREFADATSHLFSDLQQSSEEIDEREVAKQTVWYRCAVSSSLGIFAILSHSSSLRLTCFSSLFCALLDAVNEPHAELELSKDLPPPNCWHRWFCNCCCCNDGEREGGEDEEEDDLAIKRRLLLARITFDGERIVDR